MKSSKIASASITTFESAARRLLAGELVAFPTETVYGLGAHALDSAAVEKIFIAKARPKTDPLIVHVESCLQALALTSLTESEQSLFESLAASFWPGPLTIVARAHTLVPKNVTAGGDSVGLRAPAHPVAQQLLAHAKCPIAAPSANRFGHVSPTTAAHVFDDLGASDVLIIDGGASQVGVESTVVKIVSQGTDSHLEILRPGFVTVSQIEACLRLNKREDVKVVFRSAVLSETEPQQAPGQLLTHYAPRLTCYLWNLQCPIEQVATKIDLSTTILIDFGRCFQKHATQFLAYMDLSETGDVAQASQEIFSILRKAEITSGAKAILLPDVSLEDERWAAVYDRMFRAASGKLLR